MSTLVRPVVSRRNRYWISKHKYYELKHFCLQYPEWKQTYSKIASNPLMMRAIEEDPTAAAAIMMDDLDGKMRLIEDCTRQADLSIGGYIFRGVTEDLSFTYLKTVLGIPCERDMYYDRYRKFFYLLAKER